MLYEKVYVNKPLSTEVNSLILNYFLLLSIDSKIEILIEAPRTDTLPEWNSFDSCNLLRIFKELFGLIFDDFVS